MQSFTWGSDEGMQALVDKHGETHTDYWSFTPSSADFKTLINSLLFTANNAAEKGDLALCETAADLLSSIAESLGIKFTND